MTRNLGAVMQMPSLPDRHPSRGRADIHLSPWLSVAPLQDDRKLLFGFSDSSMFAIQVMYAFIVSGNTSKLDEIGPVLDVFLRYSYRL